MTGASGDSVSRSEHFRVWFPEVMSVIGPVVCVIQGRVCPLPLTGNLWMRGTMGI